LIWSKNAPHQGAHSRRRNLNLLEGVAMVMLKELFTTDIGLLSVGVIVFMLVMMGYLGYVFVKKSGEQPNQ
jgi:hypothetical protein